MKLIHIILLLLLAGLIAKSDPYGIQQEKKQKKNKKERVQDILITNPDGQGIAVEVVFSKGVEHNHPLMAVWVQDTSGNFIQTLYVAKSIATSTFNFGDPSSGQWSQGIRRRPAALPYWSFKRGIQASDGLYTPDADHPVLDAYTGATPKNDFILQSRFDNDDNPVVFDVLFEINQAWDWNEYWTNSKYPDDDEYKTSSQPSVVYKARITMDSEIKEFKMKLIGHGHYSGKDGSLTQDISTLSTALLIADQIKVYLK